MRSLTTTTLAAGLAAFALAGCGSGSSAADTRSPGAVLVDADGTNLPTINVSGHGKVEGAPDTATVTMGIETRDARAQAALEQNNTKTAALIKTLKDNGVAAKDIQTSNLSVMPNWDKDQNITGYTVTNTVTVRLRDLGKAGSTIDAAASGAGNDIRLQGVTFSIDDTSALIAKARTDAVQDALRQGRQLADAAQVELGGIRRIDNTGSQVPQPTMYYGAEARSALAAPTPIEPGSQELTVDVVVVFDIAR